MTRVLLTGSTGFVGQAFLRWFAANRPDAAIDCVDIRPEIDADGYDVYRRSNTPTGRTFIAADVRDWFRNPYRRINPDDEPYDLVIHCAAVVGGRATIDGNPIAVASDFAIDAELFQWAAKARPAALVYMSSSAAYPVKYQTEDAGLPLWPPYPVRLREDMIDLGRMEHPDSVYGLVKLAGEYQARELAGVATTTRVLVPRTMSGFGVGQALDYPAPSIVARAVRREDPIDIWSNTVRDFVPIGDVIAAIMAAVDGGVAGPFNVASGIGTSFEHFAFEAARRVGYAPDVRVLDRNPGVAYRVGDPTLMRTFYPVDIDWKAEVGRMVAALA